MTLAQSYDVDTTIRLTNAVADAVAQLTRPRLVHTDIRNDSGGIESIHTEEHPALIDLLVNIDAMQRGSGRGGAAHTRIPIDTEAHRILTDIRSQVKAWLTQLHISTSRDLKTSLILWHRHYDDAVTRGAIGTDIQRGILRKLDGWVRDIDAKYDPDQHREWTDRCPALIRNEAGDIHRCNARHHITDGEQKSAIDLNVTQLIARCRTCGTRWEGERGLMQLRYETNLRNLEEDAT
jgi:hypothetical protein